MKKYKIIFIVFTIFISLFFINNVKAFGSDYQLTFNDVKNLSVRKFNKDYTTLPFYCFYYKNDTKGLKLECQFLVDYTLSSTNIPYTTYNKALINNPPIRVYNFVYFPSSDTFDSITNEIITKCSMCSLFPFKDSGVNGAMPGLTTYNSFTNFSNSPYLSSYNFLQSKKLSFYEYPGIDSSIPAYYSTLVVAFSDFYNKDYEYYYSAGAELDRSKWTNITEDVLSSSTNPQFVINTYTYQEYFFDVRDKLGNIIYHTAYVTTNTNLLQGYKHYIFPAFHTYAYISNTIKGSIYLPKDNNNYHLGIYNYETKMFNWNLDTIIKKVGVDFVTYEYDISSLTNSILVLKRDFNDLDTKLEVIASAYVNFTSPVYDENGNFIVPGKYQDPTTGDILDFETPTQIESKNKGFFEIIYSGISKFSYGLKSIFSVISDNFHLLPGDLIAFLSLGLALFFIALTIALLV